MLVFAYKSKLVDLQVAGERFVYLPGLPLGFPPAPEEPEAGATPRRMYSGRLST